MTDLAPQLMRSSIRSLSRRRCAACHRTPLTGERLHEMDTGRVLCDLCLAGVPEENRRDVRSERVRAGERHLAVGPKAA
jgi:hypothetical protein